MASVRPRMAWIAGLVAACIAVPAGAQGNIDAGKSPAQLFSATCAVCHRRPQALKRTTASFLRRHYTAGSAEATAMAAYLAKVGSDPRAVQRERRERAKAQKDRTKAASKSGEHKDRRKAGTGKAKTLAATAKPPNPPSETPKEEPKPVSRTKVLIPFEE